MDNNLKLRSLSKEKREILERFIQIKDINDSIDEFTADMKSSARLYWSMLGVGILSGIASVVCAIYSYVTYKGKIDFFALILILIIWCCSKILGHIKYVSFILSLLKHGEIYVSSRVVKAEGTRDGNKTDLCILSVYLDCYPYIKDFKEMRIVLKDIGITENNMIDELMCAFGAETGWEKDEIGKLLREDKADDKKVQEVTRANGIKWKEACSSMSDEISKYFNIDRVEERIRLSRRLANMKPLEFIFRLIMEFTSYSVILILALRIKFVAIRIIGIIIWFIAVYIGFTLDARALIGAYISNAIERKELRKGNIIITCFPRYTFSNTDSGYENLRFTGRYGLEVALIIIPRKEKIVIYGIDLDNKAGKEAFRLFGDAFDKQKFKEFMDRADATGKVLATVEEVNEIMWNQEIGDGNNRKYWERRDFVYDRGYSR